MDAKARTVIQIGDGLFKQRGDLNSLWQEIALHFYPERADFTVTRSLGDEYADHLHSSYAPLARRELGNILSSNLRPRGSKWFSVHVEDEALDSGIEERRFLDHLGEMMWRAMYNPMAGFVRATKQADHDFVAFGNAVIKIALNQNGDGLSYQNYHLRDCVWAENAEHKVDQLHRKWEPTAWQLVQMFPKTVPDAVRKMVEKEPNKTVPCRHVVVPQRMYDFKSPRGKKFPFISLYIALEQETILEERGMSYFCYNVPRWQTFANTQYAHSMSTAICLPDGRTNNAVVRTLIEAGEKYVDPPMIAQTGVVRGGLDLYAGGLTTVDMEYDERLGEALRPVSQNSSGVPIGMDLSAMVKEDIRTAFFLDKMQLPDHTSAEMTAFETRRRIQELMRAQAPIFEPIEEDYSHPLCDTTFHVLSKGGLFPLDQMPPSLSNANLRYTFRSPLSDLAEQQDAEVYIDLMNRIWLPAAQVEPEQMAQVNLTKATRDAAMSAGWKADWLTEEGAVDQVKEENRQKQEAAEMMAQLQAVGDAAKSGGEGMRAITQAGVDGEQAA